MGVRGAILASDVLNQALSPLGAPITDADVSTRCDVCRRDLPLSCCDLVSAEISTYTCRVCGSALLVVGRRERTPWPGRGYRIGDFVLRNAAPLRFSGLQLKASPAAMAQARDASGPLPASVAKPHLDDADHER